MSVKIEFKTDDDACTRDITEIPRILHIIANQIERGETFGVVWDINGNNIGSYTVD